MSPQSMASPHAGHAAGAAAATRAIAQSPDSNGAPVVTARIAYFTNCYPKISHTFIRNEILSLERQGFDIVRITIRRSNEGLVDRDDVHEVDRTLVLLRGGTVRLALVVVAQAIKQPWRFVAVLATTLWQRPAGRLRAIFYFAQACGLADLARTHGVQHVHVHFGTNPAAIALIASRFGRLTFSMTVHGPDEFDAPGPLDLSRKIAGATFVVGVSDFGRSQLMRWSAPVDWSKLNVVRCGVAHTFREALSVSNLGLRSKNLVCVARLSAQKGLPLLLEAAEVLAQTECFCLRIVGDGALRPMIEATIAARGLGRHVELVGWLNADGVRRELLDARALILPSFAEGLPVVLMEALALGRPVIATAIAGIPELVDSRNGWLVPAGSLTALVEAMRAVLHTDRDTLLAMAMIGQKRVCHDHDIDRNAAQLAVLLRRSLVRTVI